MRFLSTEEADRAHKHLRHPIISLEGKFLDFACPHRRQRDYLNRRFLHGISAPPRAALKRARSQYVLSCVQCPCPWRGVSELHLIRTCTSIWLSIVFGAALLIEADLLIISFQFGTWQLQLTDATCWLLLRFDRVSVNSW